MLYVHYSYIFQRMGYNRFELEADYHEGLPGPNTQEEFAHVTETVKQLSGQASEKVDGVSERFKETIYRTKHRAQQAEYERLVASDLKDALEELEKEKQQKEKEKECDKEKEKEK